MTTLNARDTALLSILSSDYARSVVINSISARDPLTRESERILESLRDALAMTIRYAISADGLTVTDSQTGLTWQQAGSDKRYDFADAASYIESLNDDEFGGFDDWRLPTDHELCSIVDRSRYNPAIDPSFGCQPNYYWTSTPYAASSSDFVWIVGFSYGLVDYNHRHHNAIVRAVRGPSPVGQ